MSLQNTPAAERIHIAFVGRRNAGKSSLINAVSGQDLSIVSDTPGTTTDPVHKTMELLPLGPVVLIDTPGLDDEGELGEKRIEKAKESLRKADIVLLVIDATAGISPWDERILAQLQKQGLPAIVVFNKADLCKTDLSLDEKTSGEMLVSAVTGLRIHALKETIAHLLKETKQEKHLVCDLLHPGQMVVLVIPIDDSAPKGRLILPQQLVIRDLLDHGMIPVCCRPAELEQTLKMLHEPPALVVTDSQVFATVSKLVPREVPLTSFSILMARYKGTLAQALQGADCLANLQDNDAVLISEGCTHHRQCEDIGTVKLPGWIREYTKATPVFSFTSGGDFPKDLSAYRLIIHCGGCMLNEKEAQFRYQSAKAQGIPMTNYGTAIAKMQGILERSVEML